LIVFLKTSEEAATLDGEDIIFSYESPMTEIADIEVFFDEQSFSHKVVVTGTGIDETIDLWIDGH